MRNEAYKNIKRKHAEQGSEKVRMRGMPDIMPVGMQNFLHGRQSEM